MRYAARAAASSSRKQPSSSHEVCVEAVQGDLQLQAERLEQRLRAVLEREREGEVLAPRALAHDAEAARGEPAAGRRAEHAQPLARALGIGGRRGDQRAHDAREGAVDVGSRTFDQAREHELWHAPTVVAPQPPRNPPYWGHAGPHGADEPPPMPTVTLPPTFTRVVDLESDPDPPPNATPKAMPTPKTTRQPTTPRT